MKDFPLLKWYPTSGEEENLGQNKEVGDEYFEHDEFMMREDNIVGEGGGSDNVVGEGSGNDDVVGEGGGSDNVVGEGSGNDDVVGERMVMMIMLVKGGGSGNDDYVGEGGGSVGDDDVESNGDDGDEGNSVCCTSEGATYDALGPILEYIGPLSEAEYEDSDQPKELSEEEEEEGECSSTRKRNRKLQPSLFYRHNHQQPDVERRNRTAVLQDYLDYPPTPF
ncbi:hypothetical protein Leryth_016332 [Lithospermum erythrorhizon]|nr:hypothetical protein Leryth_016332 [Lithospermum erythrorhizon]